MYNIQFEYFKFKEQTDKFVQRCRKTKDYYVDLSDQGTGRFSKQAAFDFLLQLKADYLSGAFESQFAALSTHYEFWKDKISPGEPIGRLYGSMINSFKAWRGSIGSSKGTKKGWVVGIPPTGGKDYLKFMALELGTGPKGGRWKGGPQPGRPYFARSLNRWIGIHFGRHFKAAADITHIWRN